MASEEALAEVEDTLRACVGARRATHRARELLPLVELLRAIVVQLRAILVQAGAVGWIIPGRGLARWATPRPAHGWQGRCDKREVRESEVCINHIKRGRGSAPVCECERRARSWHSSADARVRGTWHVQVGRRTRAGPE